MNQSHAIQSRTIQSHINQSHMRQIPERALISPEMLPEKHQESRVTQND